MTERESRPGRDRRGHQRPEQRLRGGGRRSAQTPSERRRGADPARNAAFDVLTEVSASDAYANLVLPPLLRERRIIGRDAGFATELTYGTLRMRGLYDAILAKCLDRPIGALDQPLLDVLRLGSHQLLAMRVADHAAVSETVALARARVGVGPAQMVNAVLRRVSEKPLDAWLTEVRDEASSPVEASAIIGSHPEWIVRALREALHGSGRDPAEIDDLLAANNTPPKVSVAARPGLVTAEEIRQSAPEWMTVEPGRWLEDALTLGGGDPLVLPAIADGRAGVQDEGSQIAALALAAAPITGPDEKWLDLCAGPGGKAALLAALAAGRGAALVANEALPHRANLVRKALKAIPKSAVAEIRVGDGREIGQERPGAFDRVLVDAPCTGLGALRRRPEARWRRTPADLAQLTGLQAELLASALMATRPGGVVAYVTCSPHQAETRHVVDRVLRRGEVKAERIDAREVVQSIIRPDTPIDLGAGPDVQLWPHVHGTDAMHVTLLTRLA